MPTSMIVLASEQIWPNLHGILHWHNNRGGLGGLYIYNTADELRSLNPARQLECLIRNLFPMIEVESLAHKPGSMNPEEVRWQIREWIRRNPRHEWVINATGGTKLMTAGAIGFAGNPGASVVYREREGKWRELFRDESEAICSKPITVDESTSDGIPVTTLINLQYVTQAEARWEFSPAEALPITRMVKIGKDLGWDWNKIFEVVRRDSSPHRGFLFEKFVAASLLEMGIRNVACNIRYLDHQGLPLQEIDVAAARNGRIYILDCKVGGMQESLIDRIKLSATTCRTLGGLNARGLLILPKRVLPQIHRLFARTQNLSVIDQSNSKDFFSELAKFLGLECPAHLRESDRLLASSRSSPLIKPRPAQYKSQTHPSPQLPPAAAASRPKPPRAVSPDKYIECPAIGSIVDCVGLETKTKNGQWRLQMQDAVSKTRGVFWQKSAIPPDMKPGQLLKCRVRGNNPFSMQYEWIF